MRDGASTGGQGGRDLRVRATRSTTRCSGAVLCASYPALMAGVYAAELLARTLPAMTRPNPKLLGSGRYYLVEAPTGECLGCGGWSDHPPGGLETNPLRAHIRHFATHPDWTRRGVAADLRRCEADAAPPASQPRVYRASTASLLRGARFR